MNRKKTLKSLAIISILAFSLAACSGESGVITPQEIIENVVQDEKEPFAYYGESIASLSDGTSFTMKEWKDKTGKIRTEVNDSEGKNYSYAVNDGSQIWSYDSTSNEVYFFAIENEMKESMNLSPNEQAKSMLKIIENTHKIEMIGTEKLLKRDVIHVKATPNEEGSSLFGEFELWIDKETWFVLKSTVKVDGETTTQEYIKFEINPTFEKGLFTFEQPEGSELVNLDELSEETILKDINEAKQYIDKPFYYVENQNEVQLHDITAFEMEDIPTQLTFNYLNKDLPYFSLVITTVEEDNKEYGGEGLNVRGQEAKLVEIGELRSISWVQDGIGYSVLIDSVDVTTEEVQQLLETMVLN